MKNLSLLFLLTILLVACKKDKNACDGTECTYTLTSAETAATVPATVQGVYELTSHYAQAGSPFPDGTKGKFTIEENKITVEIEGQTCITLINAYQTSPSEAVFTDNCRDNYKYAVSQANHGGLNEVNLASATGTFYCQFK